MKERDRLLSDILNGWFWTICLICRGFGMIFETEIYFAVVINNSSASSSYSNLCHFKLLTAAATVDIFCTSTLTTLSRTPVLQGLEANLSPNKRFIRESLPERPGPTIIP